MNRATVWWCLAAMVLAAGQAEGKTRVLEGIVHAGESIRLYPSYLPNDRIDILATFSDEAPEFVTFSNFTLSTLTAVSYEIHQTNFPDGGGETDDIAPEHFFTKIGAHAYSTSFFIPPQWNGNYHDGFYSTGLELDIDPPSGSGTFSYRFELTQTLPAPEPSTWGLAIVGFGLAGRTIRRRQALLRRA